MIFGNTTTLPGVPKFDYEMYNGTLEVDGSIVDLEDIIAIADETDTIIYTLMGKC